jgi:hypothetical protein
MEKANQWLSMKRRYLWPPLPLILGSTTADSPECGEPVNRPHSAGCAGCVDPSTAGQGREDGGGGVLAFGYNGMGAESLLLQHAKRRAS